MHGKDFLARLREEVLIGDGALGTMLSEYGVGREASYERLNLARPDLVRSLHSGYVDAGAQVIETNTFGANRTKLPSSQGADEVRAINQAGVLLAREAAGEKAFVAGAVGPLGTTADGEFTAWDDG